MHYEVRRLQKMLRSFSGMDQMFRDVRVTAPVLSLARAAAGGARFAEMNRAGLYADLAKQIVPNSLRLGPPVLSRNLTSVGYYPRMQSDVLKQARMLVGSLGLTSSIAQTFQLHGLDPANSTAWSLRRVQLIRTSALLSTLKAATTFGPIVISPDYEDDAPFDYHPDLRGWLLPETATESGHALDVEELRIQMVAIVVSIARHHRTKALIRGLGKDGRTLLIQVAGTVI